jgi:hypothetical protein
MADAEVEPHRGNGDATTMVPVERQAEQIQAERRDDGERCVNSTDIW